MVRRYPSRTMRSLDPQPPTTTDNSTKSILARGCDPGASAWAAQALPPLMGDPEYVPTTDDTEFFRQLRERTWSVVYFAPGACRFSAARQPIPGGTADTSGWTLDQYREVVREHQGDDVQIVETVEEREALGLLVAALDVARHTS
jgi:hypothetical protein